MTEEHRFHTEDEGCFPGCPAWTSGGPYCLVGVQRTEDNGDFWHEPCWQQLVDGVCPVHGDPEVIARMLSEAEDDLAEGR